MFEGLIAQAVVWFFLVVLDVVFFVAAPTFLGIGIVNLNRHKGKLKEDPKYTVKESKVFIAAGSLCAIGFLMLSVYISQKLP